MAMTMPPRRLSFLRSRLKAGRRFFLGAGGQSGGPSDMSVDTDTSGSSRSNSYPAPLGLLVIETSAASYRRSDSEAVTMEEHFGQRTRRPASSSLTRRVRPQVHWKEMA